MSLKKFNEKVSIIIPVYNVCSYIDECISSACNQSYSNLEIIIVDDGSNDGSAEKCDLWKENDDRIRVIHKINGGLSSARNVGIEAADGKYVCFLDGDDYIDLKLVEEIVPYMSAGYDLVAYNYCKFGIDGTQYHSNPNETGEYVFNTTEDRKIFFVEKLLRYKIGWEACTRFFSKDIIDKYKLRFADNKIVFAEDVFFSLCYCAHCNKILSLDKSLYYYRQHEDSIMGRERVNLNLGRMDELGKAVEKHYEKNEDCTELLEIFPAIYFMVINNVIIRYVNNTGIGIKELRTKMFEDLQNPDFFLLQMKKLEKYEKYLSFAYNSIEAKVHLSNAKYYIDGKYLKNKIRYQLIRVYAFLLRVSKLLRKF